MNLARIIDFKSFRDNRGYLMVGEVRDGLPFVVKRIFVVGSEHHEVTRAGHAQRKHSEFMMCLRGVAQVQVEDRAGKRSYVLTCLAGGGLYVPPMTWVSVVMPPRSDLMVMASDVYEPADCIRDRSTFEEAHATA